MVGNIFLNLDLVVKFDELNVIIKSLYYILQV